MKTNCIRFERKNIVYEPGLCSILYLKLPIKLFVISYFIFADETSVDTHLK